MICSDKQIELLHEALKLLRVMSSLSENNDSKNVIMNASHSLGNIVHIAMLESELRSDK